MESTAKQASSDVHSLYILDAIGPFFRASPAGRINWSKIPFADLEYKGEVRRELFPEIRREFEIVCARAAAFGYNAISIDDLAHLFDHPAYPADLRARIHAYQEEFGLLFEIAERHGLGIYITTDIMYFHPAIDAVCGSSFVRQMDFLAGAIDDVLTRYPVAGIISRIGESDGLDVEGDFHSRLIIWHPRQARRCVQRLLPVFEHHRRTWIFRTWSVGAYRVGDLIWNRDTLHDVFDGFRSDALILSMKHGESDFFRYLPVNKQFFRGDLKRIIEIQARREYEGAGEYPSFIGGEVERFRDALRDTPNLCGIMVWCQTGGWIRFRRLTFLDREGLWNEINTWVAIRIMKDGKNADAAIVAWCRRFAPDLNYAELLHFLQLSSEVVTKLLYVDEYALRKVFFRRLRLPPLLSVFWDHVIINHSMRQLLRCFVANGDAVIARGRDAMAKIDEMRILAERLGLPVKDVDFMRDTFAIFAVAREYYFGEYTPELADRLRGMREQYRSRHAIRYSIHLDFNPVKIKTHRLRWYLGILFRDKRGYRLLDRFFTIRILGWTYPLLRRLGAKFLPEFSQKQAMGIDTLFR
ncbi:MAG: hypothetical protein ACO398_02620 [Kiritimatiellia bacterium]